MNSQSFGNALNKPQAGRKDKGSRPLNPEDENELFCAPSDDKRPDIN
jgi:hypothetical protein